MFAREKLRYFWSSDTFQISLLVVLSLIEALNILVVIGLIFQFVPMQNALDGHVLSEWVRLFRPTRDIFFYRTFLVSVFILHCILMLVFKKKLGTPAFTAFLARFVFMEFVIICFALIALYQYFVYADSVLAGKLFCLWGGLFVAVKLFWRALQGVFDKVALLFDDQKKMALISRCGDFLIPLFIFILIFAPDLSGVSARIFNGDRYYHFDGVVMSASWATLKGGIPDVDMVNPYGVGMPFMMVSLTKILGGLTYENVLAVMMFFSIVYFVVCFFLLRVWIKNVFLALAGVLLIIKLQMFHYGAVPFIWHYPNATVIRYFFDIFFFLLLFYHGHSKRNLYLILAAVCSGFSVFYVSDTGIYQLMTYFVYLLIMLVAREQREIIYRSRKDIFKIAGYFALPILVTGICLKIVLKNHFGEPVFLQNVSEQIALFVQGFSAIPVSLNFQEGSAFSFVFACLILLLYLIVVFIPAGKWYRSQRIEFDEIFAASLGIYGLLMFHYYICQATAARYFCTCVPYVFLFCWAANKFLQSVTVKNSNRISALCALGALALLATTRHFIEYPNIITLRHDTFNEDRKKMAHSVPAIEDIQLIQELTSQDDKVCLLASNETMILMQADRKPFFYYFPMVVSRSMLGRDFGGLYLFTDKRLEKTLGQLHGEKPRYVFVEKNIFYGKLPKIYYQRFKSMAIIFKYLNGMYVVEKEGKYLVALRMKGI